MQRCLCALGGTTCIAHPAMQYCGALTRPCRQPLPLASPEWKSHTELVPSVALKVSR